jgi:hypothetical protein
LPPVSRATDERRSEMYDIDPEEMHYIAADLDSREWIEAGFARLAEYLAWWSLFRDVYPLDPQ